MKTELSFYRAAIRQELDRRCRVNPRYSIRAYARSLGLNDGAVSQILSGKRIPSDKTARKFLNNIDLKPDDIQRFWLSLQQEQLKTKTTTPQRRIPSVTPTLSSEQFQLIADWYHIAILELTQNKKFKADPKYVARRLQISEAQASVALQRLIEQGHIEKNGPRYFKREKQLTTADKTLTTSAHRAHQKQMLLKAMEALDETPIESRVQVGMTMNIDPRLIPKARRMIQDFSEKLCHFLESGKREQVCQLSLSLFPLEILESKQKIENKQTNLPRNLERKTP